MMKAKVVKVNPSDLQSIMFEKSKWTVDKAKRWLKKNGFLRGDVDPGGEKANYFRFRQFAPESGFRYRSIPLGKGKGIMASVAFTGRAPVANPRTSRPSGSGLRIQGPEGRGLSGSARSYSREWPVSREEINTDVDYHIAETLGITIDELDRIPLHIVQKMRDRAVLEMQGIDRGGRRLPVRSHRNPSDDTKWAIGFVDRDGRNDRAVVYGADSNDAYRNFVRSYGRHRVFSIKRVEGHFYGNPRRGFERGAGCCRRCGDRIEPGMIGVCAQCKEEVEKERELVRLGQGQKFRHRDYEQPFSDPQLAGTRYR